MDDKKKLKVVDINDLQPDDENIIDEEEIIVDARVSIDDIHNLPPSIKAPGAKVLKATSSELVKKVDNSIIKSKRFKHYKGNGDSESVVRFMSEKYKFDKRKFNFRNILLVSLIVGLGISANIYGNPFEQLEGFERVKTIHTQTIFALYELVGKFYIPIAIILLYFFPVKENTDHQVYIYYDGLIVPSEIFSLGRPKKMRLKWADIISVEYKNHYQVPIVQLIGKRKEIIGEIRLDFDDMVNFYRILDTYCPEENPLRNIFTNNVKN